MRARGTVGGGRLGAVDPALRHRRAMPAFERRREIDLAPFGVTRRLEELIEIGEEASTNLPILRVAQPIVGQLNDTSTAHTATVSTRLPRGSARDSRHG